MSFIDEFIYRRGILLNSFVDPKEEELDTDDLEVALINESFEEQMKQRQLFYNSDLKSLFYNGEQTTTTAFLNSEHTHSQKHKDSTDSSLLIKIVPTSSPIRWPHITPHSDFDDSERGRQLDMELGRMMLDGDDEDESTFMNSLDDSCSKSTSITKYLDKSVDGISDDKTEEAEIYIDNKDISKKLPSSLNSASILEQMAACTIPATKTPSYNISSLTFLPYHHMAGGFFSSSSFESTTSQQEDEDTAAACADAAEAIAIDVVQSLFADEQYTELGATDDEAEEDDENNNMAMTSTAISPPSSSPNSNSFSSCSSFCEINKTH
ncbi:hypothetical protein ACQ4LE_010382 [Meloidogyne hapla]|uniref:Uncharacterized protein n=2 Tax=Meloidogyne hapla TaxID=6305 RepID=A0A1I8C299_MELHA